MKRQPGVREVERSRRAEPAPAAVVEAVRPAAADVLLIAACAAAWLAIALFFHPIGDHYTESDFYGAYAPGARAMLHGAVTPVRYGIYGPVFEGVVALGGLAGLDLFAAAKLVSVVAAVFLIVCWWAIVASALGRAAARWAVALCAATPIFTRHAYSATTDMLAAALSSAGLALVVLGRRPAWWAAAGAAIALATLTRYQALALFPAGLLALAAERRAAGGGFARAARAYALAFGVVLAPWCAYSLAHGVVPGGGLVEHYGFYAAESDRNLQDVPLEGAITPPHAATFGQLARERPLELAGGWVRHGLDHARQDACSLLGLAFGAAAVLGAALVLARRGVAHRGALAIAGAFLYLGLVPAFYSDRYRLTLLPLYAALAAGLWPRPGVPARARRVAVAVALAAVLVPLAWRNVGVQRRVYAGLPRDVLAVAPALAAHPDSGAVLSRKGHVGYYGSRHVAAFPRVSGVGELGEAARRTHARYLYFSWYDAQLRPEFLGLLDTTRALPGLTRIAVSSYPAGVLYVIGPAFGDPGWFDDERARVVSEARAAIWVLSDTAAAKGRVVLAVDALMNGDLPGARRLSGAALAVLPEDSLAMWTAAYAGARLAGQADDSPDVLELKAHPRFGWLAASVAPAAPAATPPGETRTAP